MGLFSRQCRVLFGDRVARMASFFIIGVVFTNGFVFPAMPGFIWGQGCKNGFVFHNWGSFQKWVRFAKVRFLLDNGVAL